MTNTRWHNRYTGGIAFRSTVEAGERALSSGRDGMAERMREIDDWERQNRKERAEYERLRKRFGDV